MSVPVKIIWAAFESDAGAISAPNYKIINNSAANDVDVTLTSFSGSSTNTDNAIVDPNLVLNLTGSEMAGNVVTGNGATATYLTIPASKGTLNSRSEWTFSLGGMWSGGFTTAYTPTYEMVLTFEL